VTVPANTGTDRDVSSPWIGDAEPLKQRVHGARHDLRDRRGQGAAAARRGFQQRSLHLQGRDTRVVVLREAAAALTVRLHRLLVGVGLDERLTEALRRHLPERLRDPVVRFLGDADRGDERAELAADVLRLLQRLEVRLRPLLLLIEHADRLRVILDFEALFVGERAVLLALPVVQVLDCRGVLEARLVNPLDLPLVAVHS
jgi:hypothetical protein